MIRLAICLILATQAQAQTFQQHFFGEVKMQDAAGTSLGSKATLIQRTLDPEASQIRVEALEMAKEGNVRRHRTTIEVSGDEIRLSNPEATFEGAGRFTAGSPWQWTQWQYKVTFRDGSGSLEGWDELGAQGIKIRKEYRDAQGTLTLKMDYELQRITPELHAILNARLAP